MSAMSCCVCSTCTSTDCCHCSSWRIQRTNSARLDTERITRRDATRASRSAIRGTITTRSSSEATSGTTPGTLRNEPSSPSSPTNANSAMESAVSTSCTTNKPMAIATSRPAPPLRSFAPFAKLTVMRLFGHGKSHDNNAARTLSRDSRQASSG